MHADQSAETPAAGSPRTVEAAQAPLALPPERSAEAEGERHAYRTHRIPWFVHLLWVLFWIFAIGYVLTYLLPAIQSEFAGPGKP